MSGRTGRPSRHAHGRSAARHERIGCCSLRRVEGLRMNVKYLSGVTAVVLACAVGMVEPAYAQRRDGNLLPQDKSGQVTAVGCLVRGNAVRGGKADKYVLARPRTGPVASVTEASCTADTGADALTLDNPEKAAIKDSM